MNIFEKLAIVQQELKAPKGNYNSFGKYNYRSCEDILEAVKPLLAKHKAMIKIYDFIEQQGERYYIAANVEFVDLEKPDTAPIVGRGYAREVETKTGMDASQITGTASSYARKYALNGLFLIDDTKDADTDEYQKQTTEKKSSTKKEAKAQDVLDNYINAGQCATIEMLLNKADIATEKFCSIYKITLISELPTDKYEDAVKKLEVAVQSKKGE